MTRPTGTLPTHPTGEAGTESIVESRSRLWHELIERLSRASWSKAPILLTGESGTGKEVLARLIHRQSPRHNGPFVAVNCGALPDNLLESELFGYRKGAFSEARTDKPGLAATAHGGTIFLDEIGEMSGHLQVKILRFLQEHEIRPLGGLRTIKVDVRVVAATNLDLLQARQQGRFRQDLYYRLKVFEFSLPPLRDRLEDIPLLTDHFIKKYNLENQVEVRGITRKTLDILTRYPWPGNIRELENAVYHAVVLARRGWIEPAHLPPEIMANGPQPSVELDREPGLDEGQLEKAITAALRLAPRAGGQPRRVGQSVPITQMIRFFLDVGHRSFPPREFATFISSPGQAVRRDKLANHILGRLLKAEIVFHNGQRAQAARYRLNRDFLTNNPFQERD